MPSAWFYGLLCMGLGSVCLLFGFFFIGDVVLVLVLCLAFGVFWFFLF